MATAQSIRDDLETVSLLITEISHFAQLAYELAGDGLDQNAPKWPWLVEMQARRLKDAYDRVYSEVMREALPFMEDMKRISGAQGR